MSSGGKSGGSANQSKNHYGTLAGALGWGPWDWISAVILNGNYIFQGNLTLSADVTDLTGSILDPSLIARGGYLKIYRGTETQPADPALVGHPPYPGTVLLVAKHIFFGQDSGTAPNIQVIGGGLPRVSTAIVAAGDNIADDGQINPIAAWAEILLDERGGGMSIAQLDAPSWLAAAAWCAQDQAHRDYTFCSPLITEQGPLRDLAKRLLEPFNGFCRWTNSGKLACNIYEWGSDPGGLPVLDARHWTKRPQFPLGDWDNVPTELLVGFSNRDYEYQDDAHLVPNARASQIRQVEDQRKIDRPYVMRAAQVHRHAVEILRRVGTAPTTATIKFRKPFLAALDLKVGDKVKIDTDPEPGGAGLAQLCRIEEITQARGDVATITVVTDNLVPATAYTPVWTPPSVVDEESPPLSNFLGVPLPPNAWGWPPSVAILATRPTAQLLGFEVYFGASHAGSFADVGQQAGFAVRGSLNADALSGATTLAITQIDGLDAPDAGIAANTPGGNTAEAGDNVLLAVLATLDGSGRIQLGADGDPLMEFVSIVDRSVASGATYNYTVLRGRMGTTARDWTAGAVVWIVPAVNLTPWRHSLLSAMLGGVAYFRMVSFTARATDDSTPVPELSVNMLPATAPMYGGNIDNDVSPDDGVTPNPVSAVTVTSHIEGLVLRWTNPTNVPLRRIFIYESSDLTRPALPQFVLEPGQTFLFRTGLPEAATREYWIEVQAINGRRTLAGPFSGTVVVWPRVADIESGLTAETAARILADNVEVLARAAADGGLSADISSEATIRLGADDELGAEYVLKVVTDGGGNRRVAGFRITNYGGAGGETEMVFQADKIALVNDAGANMVAPFALEGGVVFINTAMIKDASIGSAKIIDLVAEKITAGILATMTLTAAKTATNSVFFNTAYPSSTFPGFSTAGAVNALGGTNYSGWNDFNLGVHVYGWATGTGYAEDRFGKPDTVFTIHFTGAIDPGLVGALVIPLFSLDGGASWTAFGGITTGVLSETGQGNASSSVKITGLAGTDTVTFGLRIYSPSSWPHNTATGIVHWSCI